MGVPKERGDVDQELLRESGKKAASKVGCNGVGRRADDAYAAWMVRHPSALDMFDQIMSSAKDKNIVVFLDYDGTLSPIVDDPNKAYMLESMRKALDRVAKYVPTCIISGRKREKVHEFVQLSNVYYVGSHGLDIKAPDRSNNNFDIKSQRREIDEKGNNVVVYQPAEEFLPLIQEVAKKLMENTRAIKGVMIENNTFCITVHFRRVNEDDWNKLEEKVKSVVKNYSCLCLSRGRKIIEIRPSIDWNKGKALAFLLDTLGFGHHGALPIYIGDDLSDEDAFKVLRSRERGVPIIVSSISKDTEASYSLSDPSEVMTFLLSLSRWIRSGSSRRLCCCNFGV